MKQMLFRGKAKNNPYKCHTLATVLHRRDPAYVSRWRYEIPDWHDRFKFAIIRNPFDRLVSAYRFCSRTIKRRPRFFQGTFEEFVKFISNPNISSCVHKMQTGWDLNIFLKAHTAPLISEGYHLQSLDYLGRYENYDESVQHIFEQLGHECPKRIPHTHNTAKDHPQHYSTYYNSASRKNAENYYWADCELYDYKFEEA